MELKTAYTEWQRNSIRYTLIVMYVYVFIIVREEFRE